MHELSIANNIIEIVEEEKTKANAKIISELELEIGSMSGIIVEALEFALEEAKKNSALQQTHILYNEVMAEALCIECQNSFQVDDFFAVCPKCGSFKTDIIKGKDLKIKKLVVI